MSSDHCVGACRGSEAVIFDIRMMNLKDIDAFIAHFEVVIPQSGENGEPFFAPFSAEEPAVFSKMRERRLSGWQIPIEEAGWSRAWAAVDGDRIVGDIELDGGTLLSDMHRVGLGMALQRGYRGQGLGSRLMETAIAWARERGIEYIDLGVFDGNEPAVRLYEKFGFERIGFQRDALRVGGHKINDIHMVLAL
jgi:GNAT superfamily N-acetyltransferase